VDPLEQMWTIDRWRLWWRMQRAWRRGRAEQDATTLARLASMTGNDLVLRADPSPEGSPSIGEVTFASGTTVRLAPCSRPVLRRLASLAADQVAVLERAADHGRFWGLYFSVAGQRIGLLAREISFVGSGGGGRPMPSGPRLLLV
jgi:DNA-binding transcriptional LysR family regulator